MPKIEPYIGDYYNSEELKELFRIVRGTKIEFPVIMAAYYGLRRSEIVGLKWSAVDFNYKTIQIRHTVTNSVTDGKYILIKKNRTKTQKSLRTLPLFANVEQMNAIKNYLAIVMTTRIRNIYMSMKTANSLIPDILRSILVSF